MISMTGFATRRGTGLGYAWVWDLRSVNGKGLDLRLRVPDWIDGLEAAVRADLQKSVSRGNVSLTLKVTQNEARDDTAFRLNEAGLAAALAAIGRIEAAAMDKGVTLRQPTSADVLTLRGVVDATQQDADTTPLRLTLLADLPALITDFAAMRAKEGAALATVLGGQVEKIIELTTAARVEVQPRAKTQADALRQSVAEVLGATEAVDPTRLAQELALLAVKTDITEELDRLDAHVSAARAHLADGAGVGRKL
ncbi:MAG TPA: DUF1732 domain-containing protein, partial [Tabrizicola sp.]|nr:DUF1732 domain-containing protein [Tabrizicola sp.]